MVAVCKDWNLVWIVVLQGCRDDGAGDDRRAAMRTRPRMVADLSAAFVEFDEGHIIIVLVYSDWFFIKKL
jgi:hypothetical protein